MRPIVSSAVAIAIALASTAPAYAGERVKHRKPERPTSFAAAESRFAAQWADRPAISRIRVPGNFFLARPLERDLPSDVAQRRVRLDLRGDKPTVADLIALIEAQGHSVAVDWRSLGEPSTDTEKVGSWTVASRYQSVPNDIRSSDGSNQRYATSSGAFGVNLPNGQSAGINDATSVSGSGLPPIKGAAEETIDPKFAGAERGQAKPIAERNAPFRYFDGTILQLARRLESSGNLAVWYDDGIVIGAQRRYSVAVLQNQDVVQSVVNELKRLGAQDVVGSVGAGQITYSASPRLATDVLQPYLARVQSNLSEVRLQVALVAVRMSRDAERGFDWSKLNLQFGTVPSSSTAGSTPGTPSAGGSLPGDNTGFRGTGRTPTTLFGLTPNSFEVADTSVNIFGRRQPLSVVGAINFLSTLGESEVTQNVELASISGAPVTLRSGQSIPYATGVQANPIGGITGGIGTIASSQTDFLETGLTVNFEPRFDASSGIVTIDIGLKLVELEQFVDVSVGNQLGSLTQPQVSRQGTNAIVRVPAGQTTIIGGVRRDATSDDRNGPFGLFGLGNRKRSRDVFWLFAVVRPVVTSFETADMPSGEAVQSVPVRVSSLTDFAEKEQFALTGQPVQSAAAHDLATAPITSFPIPAALPAKAPMPKRTPAEPLMLMASLPVPATPATKSAVPTFVTRPMTAAERATHFADGAR